jgi:hypothetical protein
MKNVLSVILILLGLIFIMPDSKAMIFDDGLQSVQCDLNFELGGTSIDFQAPVEATVSFEVTCTVLLDRVTIVDFDATTYTAILTTEAVIDKTKGSVEYSYKETATDAISKSLQTSLVDIGGISPIQFGKYGEVKLC